MGCMIISAVETTRYPVASYCFKLKTLYPLVSYWYNCLKSLITQSCLSIAQAIYSFKHHIMHHATLTFIIEALHCVTYVQLF